MKRTIISILSILLLCTTAAAQEHLSLDSALSLARTNNRDLKAARLDVDKARQVRNEARTNYFPQISLSAVGYHSLNPLLELSAEDIPNAGVRDVVNTLASQFGLDGSISMFNHGVMATVSAVQPVYMGGKIVAGNRLSKEGVTAAELKAEVAERDLMLTVEQSYWLVVNLEAKQQTVDAARALVDTMQQIVAVAVEAGISTEADLLEVRLRQDELAAKSLQLANGIALARQALCQSIGIEYDPALELDTIDIASTIPSADFTAAVAQRPESELLGCQVRAEQLRRRMTLADALPHVVLGGTYGYLNIGSPMGESGRRQFVTTDQSRYLNGVVGVAVTVPLTGWWATGHKLRQADIAVRQAELQRDELTEKMELQTRQAYDQTTEAAALVTQYASTLDRAREHLRLSELNYKNGLATVADYLQAQAMLTGAENNLTDARVNYLTTLSRYKALTQK